MIKAYTYVDTVHTKLNDYILKFFVKIENDSNGFRDELFEEDFRPIVHRHRAILKERFKTIYNHVCDLSQNDRKLFCQRVIESNQIERICKGEYRPTAFDGNPTGIDKTLKELFLDLYNQVLDGNPFRENIQSKLRDHFDQFCDANKDITLCPICGIGELKKSQDECRDQYDHYLPKSLYPFSSINFYNLVPCCVECNSFNAKGDKDTIAVSAGKVFFPYDQTHRGIILVVSVSQDNSDIERIDWQLTFTNPDDKNDEINSWKSIYSIESRYQGYIKARIKKWYRHYFGFISSSRLAHLGIDAKRETCMLSLELDKSLGLSFIRKPAIDGFLSGSRMAQAEYEALTYI